MNGYVLTLGLVDMSLGFVNLYFYSLTKEWYSLAAGGFCLVVGIITVGSYLFT